MYKVVSIIGEYIHDKEFKDYDKANKFYKLVVDDAIDYIRFRGRIQLQYCTIETIRILKEFRGN